MKKNGIEFWFDGKRYAKSIVPIKELGMNKKTEKWSIAHEWFCSLKELEHKIEELTGYTKKQLIEELKKSRREYGLGKN